MQAIIFGSFIGNTLLYCFIKLNKKLQTYPMKIFMCIAFFDACYFWAFFMDRYKCDLGLNKILAMTLFYREDEEAIY